MTPLSTALLFVLMAKNYALSADTSGELIFSHVLYRYGDRTPQISYPTDPYGDISNWPVQFGQLTPIGMQQQFALGKWLRQRYGNVLLSEQYSRNVLLSEQYSPNEIYVRSSDVDRTLESAETNLAGLYMPHGNQIWNTDLFWQPIPVHTVSGAEDWLISEYVPACPVFYDTVNSLFNTDEFLLMLDEHKSIIEYISEKSGLQISHTLDGLNAILLLQDTLFIEDLYNFTLPAWTSVIYPSAEIDHLAQIVFSVPLYTTELAKIRSGYLLKDILDRSALKSNGSLVPNLSVYMYSVHGSNLFSLITALGIPSNEFIQYAACLMFELRSTSTGPMIEIFYKNSSTTDVAIPLYIPQCGYACSLSTLYELYDDIIPTQDFATTCSGVSASLRIFGRQIFCIFLFFYFF